MGLFNVLCHYAMGWGSKKICHVAGEICGSEIRFLHCKAAVEKYVLYHDLGIYSYGDYFPYDRSFLCTWWPRTSDHIVGCRTHWESPVEALTGSQLAENEPQAKIFCHTKIYQDLKSFLKKQTKYCRINLQ